MSASFEQLEKRVSFLEREQRRTNAIIDGLEARTDKNLGEINQHLTAQDSKLEELAQETKETNARMDGLEQSVGEVKQSVSELDQSVGEVKQSVSELDQSVNQRFDHVYGKLADIDANTMEIRNILASLVEKQK